MFLGKDNSKLFWKEHQPINMQTKNNITTCKWSDYARQIYGEDPKVDPLPFVNTDTNSSQCKR